MRNGTVQGLHHTGEEFGCGEKTACREMAEANQRMHECQLSRMVNSQSGDPLSIVEHGRLTEPFHFTPVQKGLQNVLLHIQIVVHHLLESLP